MSLRRIGEHGLALIRLDAVLMALLGVLMIMGLGVLYSAGEQQLSLVVNQSIRLGVGLVALLVLAQVPKRLWLVWAPYLFALALVMLLAVEWVGVGRGAQRWLDFGVIWFQPSEAMKIALPLMLAAFLSQRPLPPTLMTTLASLVLVVVPSVLILIQPDLGTAILIGTGGLAVVFLAGLRWPMIVGFSALVMAALPVLWLNLRDYQKNRILTFLDPDRDPLGQGWNIIQSKIAVGSGGWSGTGWLSGSQSHLEFLPEPHTDFIFSVLAEEFGWLGVMAVLVVYALIIFRCLQLAHECTDPFARLVIGGIVVSFFVYVVVNISMVSGLLPVVGVPLPLMSYGGTSAVTILAGFGLIQGLHSRRRFMGH
ncbi:MAG: rod shape-determining protein RodA [Wenzhouxiangella sp.]|nr:rod shape-determining protein RodA [Wenzhouxiangella sp.]MDR9453537.1 rod shape-determining protein RodA [Wenzhouxiangella sp.]